MPSPRTHQSSWIAENLHRAELTKLQRAEQIEEWRELCAQVRKNSAPVGGKQPNEAGFRSTAEALGVDEKTVRNAAEIASITPEAKEAAEVSSEKSPADVHPARRDGSRSEEKADRHSQLLYTQFLVEGHAETLTERGPFIPQRLGARGVGTGVHGVDHRSDAG